MINTVDEAVETIKQLCLNYSDEKLKDVLLFYFKDLRKVLCIEHSPTPQLNCESCKEEQMRLEAIRSIATVFAQMQNLGSD